MTMTMTASMRLSRKVSIGMINLLMHPSIGRAINPAGNPDGGGFSAPAPTDQGEGIRILVNTRKRCAEAGQAARNAREESEARGGQPADHDRGDLVEVPRTTEDWLRRRVRQALDAGDLPNEPCVSRKGRRYPGLADACREFLGEV